MAKKKEKINLADAQKVDLKATRVFMENLESEKEININIGGGASSKSYSICQLITYKFLTEKSKKILVVRKTLPSLRTSVLWLFYKILDEFGVRALVKEDKVGMNLFFRNNVIHFNGLDDPEKVKSSDWNYMWFEEATDITRLDFDTVRLYLRAKSVDGNRNQVFLTFNPIDEFHWIKEYLIDNAEMAKHVKVVHSTYKDNPFIDERTKERYEELMEQDINFYRIYALGEWGKLENLIYKNWDIVDTIPTDGKYRVLYGLDPGYNDPTAFVRCCLKDNDLYIEEVLYQPKLTNSDTIAFLKSQVPKAEWNRPIYCDSQYPDRIKEIRLEGFNIKAAQKNIGEGIDVLKRLKIHVLKTSTNLIKEFRAYSWKTDKRGMIMDEPVDFMNHGMDALRYAVYSQLRGEGVYKVRWL